MNTFKNIGSSKTIIGILVSMVAGTLQLSGAVDIGPGEQATLVQSLVDIATIAGVFVGQVYAIYGRIVAKDKITL